MHEFTELSRRSDKDQQTVFEELGRLSAGLGKSSGQLADIIEARFDEIIENFKRDRPANEEALLNMIAGASATLNSKFAKYLTIVMPLVLELATPVVPNNNNDDEDIEELPNENEDGKCRCEFVHENNKFDKTTNRR